jgi:dihydropteroate synthase-like protein
MQTGPGMSQTAERLVFITGKLAAPALESMVERLGREQGFDGRVNVAKISVAALMTCEWLAGKLELPAGTTRVVLPGGCRGELSVLTDRYPGVTFERGPEDLRDLPAYFDPATPSVADYGDYTIEILAEINHADRLTVDEVSATAQQMVASGADVIDLGCTPGSTWRGIGEVVARLVGEGRRVSVDSFDAEEVALAVAAGAELILSANGSNLERLAELGAELVVIPDDHRSAGWLDDLVTKKERLDAWGVRYRLDSILDPIGFGLADSIARYVALRQTLPGTPILMGVGNVTELTEVDSAGVNMLLIGLCAELGIESVLTTQVINWARTSVAEIDVARRLASYAVRHRQLPKHVDSRLVTLRDPKVREHGEGELARLQSAIKDPNFRIFVEGGEVVAMNDAILGRDADPFRLFERLGVEDASHAFYLGWEMAKAALAIQLGKEYTQDRALRFGYLTREEDSHRLSIERRWRNDA